MKKKILASTMASVMALSAAGTSLVSFAEVDAAYKDELTVTKAQLEKFLETKRIKELADNEAEEYGEVSAERFMKAYDYAVAVLDQGFDTTAEEEAAVNSAFLMLKAAEAKLVNHDAKELAQLVNTWQRVYNGENKLNPNNEDNDDLIYDAEDYDEFADAWEDADGLTSSKDTRAITDAYEILEKAANALVPLPTKTKTEMVKAMTAYQKAIRDTEFKYQPWQRGTLKASGQYNGKEVAWGAIYAHATSGYAEVSQKYNDFIDMQLPKTSDTSIIDAYDAMVMATGLLTGFTEKSMTTGSVRKSQSLVSTYQGQLVLDYNPTQAMNIYNSFINTAKTLTNVGQRFNGKTYVNATSTVTASTAKKNYWYIDESDSTAYKILGQTATTPKIKKVLDAELSVKNTDGTVIYYAIDEAVTLANGNHPIVDLKTAVDGTLALNTFFMTAESEPSVLTAAGHTYKIKKMSRNATLTISDYVGFTHTNIFNAGTKFNADYATEQAELERLQGLVDDARDTLIGDVADSEASIAASGLNAELDGVKAVIARAGVTYYHDDGTGTFEAYAALNNAWANLKTKAEDVRDSIKAFIDDADFTAQDIEDYFTVDGTHDGTTGKEYTEYEAYKAAITTVAAITITGDDVPVADDQGTALETAYAHPTFTAYDVTASNTDLGALSDAEDNVTTQEGVIAGLGGGHEHNADKNNILDGPVSITVSGDTFKIEGMSISGLSDIKDGSDGDGMKKKNSLVQNDEDLGKDWHDLSFNFDKYVSNSTSDSFSETWVYLDKAFEYLEDLVDQDTKASDTVNSAVWYDDAHGIDNINAVSAPSSDSKRPSGAAWKLVYTYLEYALQDKYQAAAVTLKTKTQVEGLIDDAYELVEKTANTSMFAWSNDDLVDYLKTANAWLSEANKQKIPGKDTSTKVNSTIAGNKTATEIYDALKKKYDYLSKQYAGFDLSYGDIINQMSAAAASAEKLSGTAKKAVADALAELSVAVLDVEALKSPSGDENNDYVVFDEDGMIDIYSRVLSDEKNNVKFKDSDGHEFEAEKSAAGYNKAHKAVMDAVAALEKAVKDAEGPATPTFIYDVDGKDGENINDVQALLAIVLGNGTDNKAYDYDESGSVDILDVQRLLARVLS